MLLVNGLELTDYAEAGLAYVFLRHSFEQFSDLNARGGGKRRIEFSFEIKRKLKCGWN